MSPSLRALRLACLVPLTLLATACGEESGDEKEGGGNADLELAGTWASNYMETRTLSSEAWGSATLVEFDNAANVAITQNPADDEFNPSKFNKLVWTDPDADGVWYECSLAFGQESADAARADTTVADDTDPATGGCGGFPWTRWQPAIEIHGAWDSSFGEVFDISSFAWGTHTVAEYDNAANVALTQNPADDEFNPSKFNKVLWTEIDTALDATGGFWTCTAAFGLESLDAARASAATADDADPAMGGCGGFPWTRLTPRAAQ